MHAVCINAHFTVCICECACVCVCVCVVLRAYLFYKIVLYRTFFLLFSKNSANILILQSNLNQTKKISNLYS